MEDKREKVDEGNPPEDTSDQIYSEAFELAGKDEPIKEEPPVIDDNPAPASAPAEEAVKPETDPPPPPPPEKPEVKEDYEQKWKSLQGIHRSEKEKWEAREKELLAEVEEAKKVKPPEKPADPYDSLTEEEKAALKEYEADFDVVSKMEGKKRDLALKQLKDEFMPILEEIRNKLAPVETFTSEAKTTMEEQARASHFNALASAHSDYEIYRDDGSILKWIESKPRYMQAPLLQTYQSGTTEDVIDLISDFKKENNIQPPANVVDVKSARKAAITAPVTRKAAVAAHMKVADDYEGAFDEALHKGG